MSPKTQGARGFTLLELLVVLAIVAILAALVLAPCARAKAAAQSAGCKGNLRQIGMALNLYVGDFRRYPLITSTEIGEFGTNRTTFWDEKLLPFVSNAREVFACPADKFAGKWVSTIDLPQANPSYGYNVAGTGRYASADPSLGLDGGSYFGNTTRYIAEGQVTEPSDMIAVADINSELGPGEDRDLDDVTPINLLAQMASVRHRWSANGVFCDGHVEFAKISAWLHKSDRARQRWNNDHLPHPETWVNDPY